MGGDDPPGIPARARDHQAERIPPAFAGQLQGDVRVDDRARVNGADRRLKNLDAFEKERSFLWEEDRKPLVGRNHQLIRLDLREVRIDREVEGDSWRQRVFAR